MRDRKEQFFSAAIFDMDGILVDSEPFWMLAEKEVFKEVGFELTDEMCIQTRGLRIREVVEYWFSRFNVKASVSACVRQLEQRVTQLIEDEGKALPGVEYALNLLKEQNLLIGLASSSSLPIIKSVIHKLNIAPYFDHVISAYDLPYGKPHPHVYLLCAEHLGVKNTQCIAFEDSVTGLISCKAASMKAIAIPEAIQFNDPRFSIADIKLTSFNELLLEHINSI
ncbi:MAG: hexitol phosphatase HxpB [Pseudomonadota bacterium]